MADAVFVIVIALEESGNDTLRKARFVNYIQIQALPASYLSVKGVNPRMVGTWKYVNVGTIGVVIEWA